MESLTTQKHRVFIVYSKYIYEHTYKCGPAGLNTYISNLLILFHKLDYQAHVYQYASYNFTVDRLGGKVVGVKHANTPTALLNYILSYEQPDLENDILLFATDFLAVRNPFKHSIAIQHGVAWDIPPLKPAGFLKNMGNICLGALRAWRKYMRYRHCQALVCVDYNFVNWYRTQLATIPNKMVVIPNFTALWDGSLERTQKDAVSIIFARRLVPYRGTRLFTQAILPLLKKYPHIKVTVAGIGPDESYMKQQLGKYSNVHFTSFEANDSLKIHAQHDIAVVPTTGSEGTSLSLLEAMSAGCAVIASNVGGLTNILINNHNGMLIAPEQGELTNALEKLITDAVLRRRLAAEGRKTVEDSFSLTSWQNAWIHLLHKLV